MKTNWDLTYLCENMETALKIEEELKKRLKNFQKSYQDTFKDYDHFEKVIQDHLKINELLERVYCYYKRHVDLNRNDQKMQENFNRALDFYDQIQLANQRYIDFLYDQKEKTYEFLKQPTLSFHALYIERFFDLKKYHVSEEIKKRESEIDFVIRSLPLTYRYFQEEGMHYEEIEDEDGIFKKAKNTFITQDREIRKKSYEASRKARKEVNYVFGSLLDMKTSSVYLKAELAGFSDPLAKTLQIEEVPSNFVDVLLEKIKGYSKINHDYVHTMKNYFQLDAFYTYDLSCPLQIENKKYSLDEARKIITNALKPFGDEHIDILNKAFDEGWGDFYAKKGKRTDSVSMITYAGVPYFTLNYKDDFFSMRSLCHELGHSIHSYYAKAQPYEYFEYNLFIAEIASLVHEEFLYDYLYQTEENKVSILRDMLVSYRNSLFAQSILSCFEKDVYEEKKQRKTLDAAFFNECYLKNEKLFYGDDLILTEMDGYDWQHVPQFFLNQPFYMWKYTVDRLIAIYVHKKLTEDPSFMGQYKEFLRKGNSLRTKELLAILGIDLENPSFIDEAFEVVEEKMNEFKNLLK